jgi:CubicO group peptidase (beta-lactamase class C family)
VADAITATLAAELDRWPGPAAAGVLVKQVLTATAGPIDQTFAWASVSKLLVALAGMVAVEEGTVGLDEPAGPKSSTLAHLLAHASGLPFEGDQPIAPPGRRRIYSNTGIEVAAGHIEGSSGMPFYDYLRTGVLEPLAMNSTVVDGSPAHGGQGPVTDLLRLAAELSSPTLVSAGTWRRATSVAWPGLSGVLPGFGRQDPCDWGLGPEIRSHKSPHWTGRTNSPETYGHFGQSGSFLWVDPVAGVAVAALGSTPFGPWAIEAWPALADAVLAHFA